MIRIYLDWNVVSNLKRPENKELKEFIDKYKEYFLFPYSPAHFNDLMKSYSLDNVYFNQDLEMLEYLSEKHLIRWEEKKTALLFLTPKAYFEGRKDDSVDVFEMMDMENLFSELDEMSEEAGLGKMGAILKSLYEIQSAGIEVNDENREMLQKIFPNLNSDSSMWDLMKDILPFAKKFHQDKGYYKDFRKSIGDKGFKVQANAGNWNEKKVIDNIDAFLKEKGTEMTFIEYIEMTFKHREEPINRYEFFTTAYLMLDIMGYKADKLPKPTDNMQNIQIDGEHSFYAAHCDFFVVGDKKLRIKSNVLYKKFDIPTKVIQPNELIHELKKIIYEFPENGDFISDVFNFVNSDEIVESFPYSKENEAHTHVIKLSKFYFNFFNYVVYRHYPDQKGVALTFKKFFENYADSIYFTECEKLIETIASVFGYDEKEKLETLKREFVYENKLTQLIWYFTGGKIILEKDSESKMPTMTYFFPLNEKDEIVVEFNNNSEKDLKAEEPIAASSQNQEKEVEVIPSKFNSESEMNFTNLESYMNFRFSKRKKSNVETSNLLEELLKSQITFHDIEAALSISSQVIAKKLENRKITYSQCGIIRTSLNLVNDNFWIYTRSKSIQAYPSWVEKMEKIRIEIKKENSD